jgi:hypothetical protein
MVRRREITRWEKQTFFESKKGRGTAAFQIFSSRLNRYAAADALALRFFYRVK